MKPERLQRRRVKGYRLPPGTVCVTRQTKWGNPYRGPNAADKYRATLATWSPGQLNEFLAPLRGKNLACFCPIGAPCHADVLLELANKPT